jgi:hypothetical protein
MKTEDVASQLMKNDLNRAMQEWLCASQVEMTCHDPRSEDHSWERHLRILRRRLEEIMETSVRFNDPPWSDISVDEWELLWTGEENTGPASA